MLHSYSSLSTFEQCPQKYYQTRVLRAYPYVPSEEAKWGDRAHKALEQAGNALVSGNLAGSILPPEFAAYQWVINNVVAALPGTKLFEFEFSFTARWLHCGARDWSIKTWTGKGDVIGLSHDRKQGVYLDYKTGNDRYPDVDQLELMTVFMKTAFPTLEYVRAGLLFLQSGKPVTRDYTEHQFPLLRTTWEAKARDVELAQASNTWPMKKSSLCPYCPHKTCPNWTPPKPKAAR